MTEDELDEEIEETFPASDPPADTVVTAVPIHVYEPEQERY